MKKAKILDRFVPKEFLSFPLLPTEGWSGERWVAYLKECRVQAAPMAEHLLCSCAFQPSPAGIEYRIKAFRGEAFPGSFRASQFHLAAKKRGWRIPHPEVALLIVRSMIRASDEYRGYDLGTQEGFVVMHQPLLDGGDRGTPYLLGMYCSPEGGISIFTPENDGFTRGFELSDGGMKRLDLVFVN